MPLFPSPPWHYQYWCHQDGEGGRREHRVVARIYDSKGKLEQVLFIARFSNEETAKAVAAMPELLEACRLIAKLGDWTGPAPRGFTEAWEAAVAAIAKAAGGVR